MDKPALTKYDIHPLLNKRWSPRSFTDKPVSKTSLQRIFEAARWAPSSFNDQPWRYIVGIKGDDTWDKIMDALVDFNKNWAKLAPVLAITVGSKVSAKTGKPNAVYQYDMGQSIAHLTVQATEEGLFMHQMGGLDKEKAAQLFDVPDNYQVITAFALGHKGDPELLDGDFVKMEKDERQRKPLTDLVFSEKFGKSFHIIE